MRILNKEFIFPYLLLIFFFVPWSIIGLGQYEIRIKELFIISIIVLLFMNFLIGRKVYIDRAGKFYFYFLLFCIFYTFVNLFRLNDQNEINLLIHVLLFTVLNFSIYFIILNLNLNNFNLQKFVNFFFLIYLFVFIYFLNYANNLHVLGQEKLLNFYTLETEMLREGKLIGF